MCELRISIWHTYNLPSYLISIETRQTFEYALSTYFGTILYARSNNFFPIETVDPILNLRPYNR